MLSHLSILGHSLVIRMPYSCKAADPHREMTNIPLSKQCWDHGQPAGRDSIILKNKTSGESPGRNDMSEQSSSIAIGTAVLKQSNNTVDVVVDAGHSAAGDEENDVGGTPAGGGSARKRSWRRSLDFVRWASFSRPLRKRAEAPLLSSLSHGTLEQSSVSRWDETCHAFFRKLLKIHGIRKPKRHVRNPYRRTCAAVFVALGIAVVMSAYQEVVLGVGIAGCGRDALFQEKCEGTIAAFVTRPLVFRQVGHIHPCYLHFPRLSTISNSVPGIDDHLTEAANNQLEGNIVTIGSYTSNTTHDNNRCAVLYGRVVGPLMWKAKHTRTSI